MPVAAGPPLLAIVFAARADRRSARRTAQRRAQAMTGLLVIAARNSAGMINNRACVPLASKDKPAAAW
jgi:hypothetical protein